MSGGNPYHDEKGRFTDGPSGGGGGAAITHPGTLKKIEKARGAMIKEMVANRSSSYDMPNANEMTDEQRAKHQAAEDERDDRIAAKHGFKRRSPGKYADWQPIPGHHGPVAGRVTDKAHAAKVNEQFGIKPEKQLNIGGKTGSEKAKIARLKVERAARKKAAAEHSFKQL